MEFIEYDFNKTYALGMNNIPDHSFDDFNERKIIYSPRVQHKIHLNYIYNKKHVKGGLKDH